MGIPFLENRSIEKKDALEGSSEIGILLGYFQHVDSLSEEALEKERSNAQKAFSEFNNSMQRLRFAIVLSLSPPDSRDYHQALELLKPDLKATGKQDFTLRDFSRFFYAALHRLKIREEHHQEISRMVIKHDARYRELLNEKHKTDDQVQNLIHDLKEEQTRSRELEKIIEELKTIEKNIMKRENEKPDR